MQGLVERIRSSAGTSAGAQLYLHASRRPDLTSIADPQRRDPYVRASIGIPSPDHWDNYWHEHIRSSQNRLYSCWLTAADGRRDGSEPFEVLSYGRLCRGTGQPLVQRTLRSVRAEGWRGVLGGKQQKEVVVRSTVLVDEPQQLSAVLEHGTSEPAHFIDYSFNTSLRDGVSRLAHAAHCTLIGDQELIREALRTLRPRDFAQFTDELFNAREYPHANAIVQARLPASRIAVVNLNRFPQGLVNGRAHYDGIVRASHYEQQGFFRPLRQEP